MSESEETHPCYRHRFIIWMLKSNAFVEGIVLSCMTKTDNETLTRAGLGPYFNPSFIITNRLRLEPPRWQQAARTVATVHKQQQKACVGGRALDRSVCESVGRLQETPSVPGSGARPRSAAEAPPPPLPAAARASWPVFPSITLPEYALDPVGGLARTARHQYWPQRAHGVALRRGVPRARNGKTARQWWDSDNIRIVGDKSGKRESAEERAVWGLRSGVEVG